MALAIDSGVALYVRLFPVEKKIIGINSIPVISFAVQDDLLCWINIPDYIII